MLLLVATALAETLYATGPVEAVRWPGAPFVTTKLDVGDAAEVVTRQGELVRVRVVTDFGWVPAAALAPVPPPVAPGAPAAPAEPGQ